MSERRFSPIQKGLAVACVVGSSLAATNLSPVVKDALSYYQGQAEACPPVDPNIAAEADNLLDQGLATVHDRSMVPDNFDYRETVAKSLGLTIHNYNDYFGDISSESTPDAYLKAADSFLKLYGVELSVTTNEEQISDQHVSPPSWDSLTDSTAGTQLLGVAMQLSNIPVEGVKTAGLKEVVLTNSEDGNKGFVAPGKPHTIYIDLQKTDADAFDHELSHVFDHQYCADVRNDEEFADLNPTGEDIYDDPGDWISAEANQQAWRPDQVGNPNKVVSQTDYGLTALVEDKADVGKKVFTPNSYTTTDNPKWPVLRAKFRLLAQRLYSKNKDVLRYFTAVTR